MGWAILWDSAPTAGDPASDHEVVQALGLGEASAAVAGPAVDLDLAGHVVGALARRSEADLLREALVVWQVAAQHDVSARILAAAMGPSPSLSINEKLSILCRHVAGEFSGYQGQYASLLALFFDERARFARLGGRAAFLPFLGWQRCASSSDAWIGQLER